MEKDLVDQLRTTMKQHTDKLKALGYDLVPQLAAPLQPPVNIPPQPAEVRPQPADTPFVVPPPASPPAVGRGP
jgi:hypothetical protein